MVKLDLQALVAAGLLAPELEEPVLALGATAIPSLVELIEREPLCDEDFSALYAVRFLGKLGAPEAGLALLRVVEQGEAAAGDIVHDQATLGLKNYPSALEDVLSALERAQGTEVRNSLLEVLSGFGVRDERIYAHLVEAWADETPYQREFVASCFGAYGDERALPLLREAFDATPLEHPQRAFRLNELRDAIEQLGAELSEEQERAWHEARRPKDPLEFWERDLYGFDGLPSPERVMAWLDELCERLFVTRLGATLDAEGRRLLRESLEICCERTDPHLLEREDFERLLKSDLPRELVAEPAAAPQLLTGWRAFWQLVEEDYGFYEDGIDEVLSEAEDKLALWLGDSRLWLPEKGLYLRGKSAGFDMDTEEGVEAFFEQLGAQIERERAQAEAEAKKKQKRAVEAKKRKRKQKRKNKRRNR